MQKTFLLEENEYVVAMLVVILRFFYVLLPVGLFMWFTMDRGSFNDAIAYANSLQGKKGKLVINHVGKKSVGIQTQGWLEKEFKTDNENWRYAYRNIGSSTDAVIDFVENYWLWGGTGVLLLAGAFYLLAHKNYK